MPGYKHLTRLPRIWIDDPIFFITTNTNLRHPILANSSVAQILIDEWHDALERHGWMVGRYVIMPDHVHFFCAPAGEGTDHEVPVFNDYQIKKSKDLSGFIQQWKQWTSKRISREIGQEIMPGVTNGIQIPMELKSPVWQEEFFDHLLRSQESYEQKWEYVSQNPVRKGLVRSVEEWQWQGEIFQL